MKFFDIKHFFVLLVLMLIPLGLQAQPDVLDNSQDLENVLLVDTLYSNLGQENYFYYPGQEEPLDESEEEKPVKPVKPSFVDVSVGILGIYSLLDKAAGAEFRFSVESSYISLPIQYQWLALGEMMRLRTWPSVFFKKRSDGRDAGVFVSLFNDSIVRGASHKISRYEVGMGGGFSGLGFALAAWLTTSLTQGKPKVRDLFSFRTLTRIAPIDFFYLMIGFRIGAALAEGEIDIANPLAAVPGAPARIVQKIPPTSAATIDLEIEIGAKIWTELRAVFALEGRSDNFGALLDKKAAVGGISSAIQILIKFGATYTF